MLRIDMKKLWELVVNQIRILRGMAYYKHFVNPKTEKNIINSFHRLYYDSSVFNKTWGNTRWLGIKTFKCPLDCWIYQEILFEQKPDIIIESGTANGGSALYLAGLCDLMHKGRIVTIDIESSKGKPRHKRIKYLVGSSTSDNIVEKVKRSIGPRDKVLVILDSDHSYKNVIKELRIYKEFVQKGGYLIVEDTNLNGHPVRPNTEAGPMEAVEEFLSENKDFVVDKSREKFYLTFNPSGYLLRIR